MRCTGFRLTTGVLVGLLAAACVPMWSQPPGPGAKGAEQPRPAHADVLSHVGARSAIGASRLAALPDVPDPAPIADTTDGAPIAQSLDVSGWAGAFPDGVGGPGGAAPAGDPEHHPGEREVSWKTLPRDFLHDEKDIWGVFPSQVARGHHWVPVLAVTGITAGLIFADPHAVPYFHSHAKNLDKLSDVFDPMISTGEIVALPAGLLAAGYVRHDDYQVNTGLLAALAYGDSVVPTLAIKAIARRERPSAVPTGQPYTGTFFHGGTSPLKGSSFPSAHSAAAFSVATVVAYRYRNHKWVPPLAYGMATAIGLSRILTQAHFPSDVFLGSAIGYTVARYQTVRPQ